MPVPFGFSVGDFVSVCILIKDAIRALDTARGSAAEYREVIRELWALDRALLEVMNLAQNFETTVELIALSHTARRTTDQYRACIEGFLEKLRGYEKSLRDDGSGNKWRDAKRKVVWAMVGKADLNGFRAEINGHSSAINMLLITASVSLTRLNGNDLRGRLKNTQRANQSSSNQQLAILGQVKDTLDEHTRSLDAQGSTGRRLAERMKYFFTLGAELKAFMVRIWTLNFRSYNILLDLQTRVPREFRPCWIQEPLILTDALGRVAPVHLELINTWEVLESVLAARFQNIPGERKVRDKEYALMDGGSLKDIERSSSFETSFFPGRRVDMSIVFKQGHAVIASCPGCKTHSQQDNASVNTCKHCGLWFQRIEEIVELRQAPYNTIDPLDSAAAASTNLSLTPQPAGATVPQLATKKRKIAQSNVEENIGLFKRVRLLRRKHITKPVDSALQAEVREQEKSRTVTFSMDLLTQHELQLAAFEGRLEDVEKLLGHGANVNEAVDASVGGSLFLCTALDFAVHANHTKVVKCLLENGADPNKDNEVLWSPLISAVRQHRSDMVEILLSHGADVHQTSGPNTWGHIATALRRASWQGDLDTVRLLLSYGADVNARGGHFGRTLAAAASNGNVLVAEQLLDAGAQIDATNNSVPLKSTALGRAISNGHIEMVKLLVGKGANINRPWGSESAPQSAVHCAAFYGREEILEFLVNEAGGLLEGSADSSEYYYLNALEAAADGGQGHMFQKLLATGMDTSASGIDAQRVLQFAARSGADSILKYLLGQGVDVNLRGGYYTSVLITAAYYGNLSTCQMLIDNGADLHVYSERHGYALHAAVQAGQLTTVRLLLDAGARINAIGGKYGTVLQAAALNAPESMTHLLLEAGADPNVQAGYFGNALQAWSYVGGDEIVRVLLDEGADPNAIGGYYGTALNAAIHEGYESTIEILLRHGADPHVIIAKDKSALSYAMNLYPQGSAQSERIMDLLRSAFSFQPCKT